MVVRFSVVVVALGLGSFLGACGSTKKQPQAESPVACDDQDCPDDCDPSSKFCFERQVWRCAADGKSATVLETCDDAEECQESGQLTRCEAASTGGGGSSAGGSGSTGGSAGAPSTVCVPGERQCGEGQVLMCNGDGTALEPHEACELGQTCDQGECVEQVCTPGAKSCVENGVHQCDPAGLNDVLVETCGLYQHCVQVPAMAGALSSAYCTQNTCQPEQVLCDGNVIKVCNDDGTLPAAGTDCGEEFCMNGACEPQICEPFTRVCKDGDVHDCPYPGVTTTPAEICDEGMRCTTLGSGVVCGSLPCEAGSTACLGNAYGTCAPDGEGLSVVTQNCASTQQVCSVVPSCVDSVVETLAVAENVEGFGSGAVFGNIIDVHSDRQLTKLEANLVLEAARDLRWVVYELTDEGFYVQRAMEITSNNSGSAFFGSSELTWKLEAGKRYMLGVGLVVFEGYCYYDAAPFNEVASFGTVLGGTSNGYDTEMYFDPNAVAYRLRITSELP